MIGSKIPRQCARGLLPEEAASLQVQPVAHAVSGSDTAAALDAPTAFWITAAAASFPASFVAPWMRAAAASRSAAFGVGFGFGLPVLIE